MNTESHLHLIEDLLNEVIALQKDDGIPLTQKQAAFYLGCDRQTIGKYERKGILHKEVNGPLVGYTKKQLDKIKLWKQG